VNLGGSEEARKPGVWAVWQSLWTGSGRPAAFAPQPVDKPGDKLSDLSLTDVSDLQEHGPPSVEERKLACCL